MKVLRAKTIGMCPGVHRALDIATHLKNPREVAIHGELVHNEEVLEKLAARGFVQMAEEERAALAALPKVMITAHGVSKREKRRLIRAGKRLIDATCPLVERIQQTARQLNREGRLVIVIGDRRHVEVRGIVEDLAQCAVVARPEKARAYATKRLGVVCQSTTSEELAREVLAAIRARNPQSDIRYCPTICQATRERQAAVRELLPLVDVLVVVGGKRSNNTRELANLARANGSPCHLIQTERDLRPEWFAGARTVGLTAGASTPDWIIAAVDKKLSHLGRQPRWLTPIAPFLRLLDNVELWLKLKHRKAH